MSMTCEVLTGLFVLFIVYVVLRLREAGDNVRKWIEWSNREDDEEKKE